MERMRQQPIVIIDDDGTALGSVVKEDDKMILLNIIGKEVSEVSKRMTIKEVKNLLLRNKYPMVV